MNSNRVIAIILLAFILFWGYLTTKLPETTLETEPGPKFFPTVILVGMAILSVILFFAKDKKAEAPATDEPAEESGQPPKEEKLPFSKVVVFYGILFVALIVIRYIGFIAGMCLGVFAMLFYVGWKIPRALFFSVIATVLTYLFFDTLFKIPLPSGILF